MRPDRRLERAAVARRMAANGRELHRQQDEEERASPIGELLLRVVLPLAIPAVYAGWVYVRALPLPSLIAGGLGVVAAGASAIAGVRAGRRWLLARRRRERERVLYERPDRPRLPGRERPTRHRYTRRRPTREP